MHLRTIIQERDEDSGAYQAGYAVGRIVGVVAVIIVIVWVLKMIFGKK